MPNYKKRECTVCGSEYSPVSPKQRTCSKECSKILKKDRDLILEKSKRVIHNKKCPLCSTDFQTTDSKKLYCGAKECEEKRKYLNNKKADEQRSGKRSDYKNQYHKENQDKILKHKKVYYREVIHPDRDVKDGWSTFKLSYKDAKKTFSDEGYTLLDDTYINSYTKMKVRCPRGHEWETSLHNFKDGRYPNRCFYCYLEDGVVSKPEQELADFVQSVVHGNTKVERNVRHIITPYELDIFVPSKNVAIEYCGLRWHGEVFGGKENKYHYNKMAECNKRGIRLLTIFEDEYIDKPEVVRSRIRNSLGSSEERIFARKTQFGVIPKALCDSFLHQYHLQGKGTCKYRFGLYDKCGRLVSVMTFGHLSRAHTGKGLGNVIELKRFASFPGISVVGGASKMLKNAIRLLKMEGFEYIKSYCDMRWANQVRPVYETLGFELQAFTKYTPHYIQGQKRIRNQALRKTPQERLTGKTEWELRREQGYDRIWDCGHRTYIHKI